MVLSACMCTVRACRQKHIPFTHIADTRAEESSEPAAEIQVALDHFTMVYFSICLSSFLMFFFLRGLFTRHLFHSLTPLSPFLFLFFHSFCFHCLMFSLSDLFWTNRGVWNASLLTCVLWAYLIAPLYFYAKPFSIYCWASSHTAQAHACIH